VSDLLGRVAGAPISWGVDGSPGWGFLMDRERVLAEMVAMGLRATELGPDGYLPTDPGELAALMRRHRMRVVGGFVPALLYRAEAVDRELDYVSRAARQLASTGSTVLVLGPSSHHAGYDTQVDMSEEEWTAFLVNLGRVETIARAEGLRVALHPHWGMAISSAGDVDRLLDSSTIGLCLDTGHLSLGGADPVEIARRAGDRVLHVHLKDLEPARAGRVRRGDEPFRQAVIDGLFVPLGRGGVDIAGTVAALEAGGYRGWYVLEQDCALPAEPPVGGGPAVDARDSLAYLRALVGTAGDTATAPA
jgi:inosose dehydratase